MRRIHLSVTDVLPPTHRQQNFAAVICFATHIHFATHIRFAAHIRFATHMHFVTRSRSTAGHRNFRCVFCLNRFCSFHTRQRAATTIGNNYSALEHIRDTLAKADSIQGKLMSYLTFNNFMHSRNRPAKDLKLKYREGLEQYIDSI